ncbi:hypothetical protein KR044_003857 [Drosophila immigrans]|nr:hypothetical protein KR044_003857 [Drosophila immigrans]
MGDQAAAAPASAPQWPNLVPVFWTWPWQQPCAPVAGGLWLWPPFNMALLEEQHQRGVALAAGRVNRRANQRRQLRRQLIRQGRQERAEEQPQAEQMEADSTTTTTIDERAESSS